MILIAEEEEDEDRFTEEQEWSGCVVCRWTSSLVNTVLLPLQRRAWSEGVSSQSDLLKGERCWVESWIRHQSGCLRIQVETNRTGYVYSWNIYISIYTYILKWNLDVIWGSLISCIKPARFCFVYLLLIEVELKWSWTKQQKERISGLWECFWVDGWVASHFSAALCRVFFSSYTDEISDRGPDWTSLCSFHCGITPRSPSAALPHSPWLMHDGNTAAPCTFRKESSQSFSTYKLIPLNWWRKKNPNRFHCDRFRDTGHQ